MADVSHELGALRFVVDSPLSSKVAMFNNQATQHKQSQLLNPFSQDGRASSPKPTFSKDQYGKPLAGSLTEARGQKANMHVMKEMLELCQIINTEGYDVKDEQGMRVIPFGELFNIYNYISDKVVGILLRARKHKLVEFEGEMLYQRRDDNVPIFLLKPIREIRSEMEAKIEEIKRAASPAPPQSTSVLLDRSAHEQHLKARTPSPAVKSKAKAKSPSPSVSPAAAGESKPPQAAAPAPAPAASATAEVKPGAAPAQVSASIAEPAPTVTVTEAPSNPEPLPEAAKPEESPVQAAPATVEVVSQPQPEDKPVPVAAELIPVSTEAEKTEAALPTIVIEASAVFVRTVSTDQPAADPSPADTSSAAAKDESTPTLTPVSAAGDSA
ncbi:translation initiation factor IF-2 [Drosophila obscura]|uniref:translation initiation factor IF-2 n=1 Tax=Drosophila obscura TaxID=7282 RepID=UPI001BB26389|nr:translation initiation factor IF-2 [Drosophila obscura]